MKFLLITPTFFPTIGGVEVSVDETIRGLKAIGHEGVCLTTRHSRSWKKRVPYPLETFLPGILSLSERSPSVAQKLIVKKICQIVRKHEIDALLWVMAYPFAFCAEELKNHISLPQLLVAHGSDIQKDLNIPYGVRLDPEKEKRVKKALTAVDECIGVSESILKEFESLGVFESKRHVIPNGVVLSRHEEAQKRRIEIRKKLGFENKTILLTVGRNHPKKGFHQIPEILNKIENSLPDVLWILVGRDMKGLASSMQKHIESGRAQIWGEISVDQENRIPSERLIELFVASDIFVFPTLLESFGMVTLEAMAAGLPVVTTNAPGSKELIQNGVNGISVDAGNLEGIASATVEIAKNPALKEKFIAQGKKTAFPFRWETIASQYVELVERVRRSRFARDETEATC